MSRIDFANAYYIKLGQGGMWEPASIRQGRLRIGWSGQSLKDINKGNWSRIATQIRQQTTNQSVATRDLNALKWICQSTPDDVWITFHRSRLWWCRVGEAGLREDGISKYRRLSTRWSDQDVSGSKLLISRVPGSISKLQGFRGTVCHVREKDVLRRLISDRPSDEYAMVQSCRRALATAVEKALGGLHWKDFETLVDLIFRATGWRRVSAVGETMKTVDIELEEPITGDTYAVQVKSRASSRDYEACTEQVGGAYRKVYFVVHSPDAKLAKQESPVGGEFELVLPARIADMVVDLGLVQWVLHRIR